jgi:fatty-acyl-CoA synthase
MLPGHETFTYRELWNRCRGVADQLAERGIGESSTLGLLADNSPGFLFGMVSASIVGADVVLMNPGFAAPQLADVTDRESVDLLLIGERFESMVTDADVDFEVIDELAAVAAGSAVDIKPSRRAARMVILTSGTTGRPKGARRGSTPAAPVGGMLSIIPIRSGDTVLVAAPMFHAWGFAHTVMSLTLASTIVTSASFNPELTLAALGQHRVDGLVAVPAMLQRMLERARDGSPVEASWLRYIASSGSAIHPSVVEELLVTFGPVLYNTYGSTEASIATIAAPADLASQASTAGRVVPGVRVAVLDDRNVAVADGTPGRIFVDAGGGFEGYTGGGDKERVGALVSTGDTGRFVNGLLFVEGRSDDMIVSGGENVFPDEVEAVIAAMAGVADVAVVGVPDDAFGQRLAAYVVKRPNAKVSADEVRDEVRAKLARYKVPRDVQFVNVLPRTESGKVIRRELSGMS